MMKHIYLIFFISIICATQARSQFSIDVGYFGSTLVPNNIRPVIQAFNSYLPDNARAMKRMNYMNGFSFGFSSTGNPTNLMFEYNGSFASLSAKRLVNANNGQYNYIFNYSTHAVGPGFNVEAGKRLLIGGSVLYNFLSFKNYTSDNNSRQVIKKQQLISLKPFFDIVLGQQNDRVNASLRFFANIPLKKTDISNVYNTLDPENRAALTSEQLNTRMTTLGVSLILHNKRY